MKSAITISLVPETNGGPFVFREGMADGCDRAAALGFDGVEVFAPAASAIDIAELTALLARNKVQLAALGTGAGWVLHKWSLTHPEASVRARARDFVRAMIDLAAGFGAPAVLGSIQGRWEGAVSRSQALAWFQEALEDLGTHAAARSQVLLYEPLNRYETNLFNRLGDAAAFLDNLQTSSIKLLADLFHMNIEETSIPDALRAAAGRIGHVHFADSNRHAIGFGHTDIPPIIAALREGGYQGYLSAEILPLPDSQAAARETIESFRKHTS
jgi:sugar phosphate isomerase/epimerase